MKGILQQVCEDVEGGNTLSESFAKHPKAFDRLYTKMVKAGEIGGVLDVILQRLADFMEKGQRLRRRIKGALIYPTVVIFIAVAIVTGIMYFVIPKFQEIFNDFNVKLPALTLWLVSASKWIAGTASPDQRVPGVIWIISAPFVVFFLFKVIRRTPYGRAATDWIVLKIPVIGNLVQKTTVARFTRTLGTLHVPCAQPPRSIHRRTIDGHQILPPFVQLQSRTGNRRVGNDIGLFDVRELFLDESVPVQRQNHRRVGTRYCGNRNGKQGQTGRSDLVFNAIE